MGPNEGGCLEWVDAEAPEWSGSPAEPESTPAAPTSAASAALRAQARARAARRRAPLVLPPPWEAQEVGTCRFCVIDLETAGGGAGRDDEVVEIGAVQVQGFELGREFATLVQPLTLACASTAASAAQAPSLEQALPWLLEMGRDRVLVFHNVPFDLPLLQRACSETRREIITQPVLDTLVLARCLLGSPCALVRVAGRLGLGVGVLHRALEDARLTARVLLELLQLCMQAGIARLDGIPGVRLAPAKARGRHGPRVDPLLERLKRGIAGLETLQVSYHGGAGLAPLVLVLRPERLVAGRALLAFDVLRGAMVWLDVVRIGRVLGAA